MAVTDFLNRDVKIYERDDIILPPATPADAMKPVGQPSKRAFLEVRTIDVQDGGSVIIYGTKNGGGALDVVDVVPGSNVQRSRYSMDTVYELDASAITGGTISLRTVEATGEPIFNLIEKAATQGRMRSLSGKLRYSQTGRKKTADYELSIMSSGELVEGRIVKIYSRYFEITFVSEPGELGNVLCDLMELTDVIIPSLIPEPAPGS